MASVEFETHGKVALIRLNRPAMRNAVNAEMTSEMRLCLLRFEADPAIVAGVLTGTGPFFCAGMDLGALPPVSGRASTIPTGSPGSSPCGGPSRSSLRSMAAPSPAASRSPSPAT